MPAARFMTPEECAAWHWTVEPRTEDEHLSWLLMRWAVDPVMFAVEALRIILQRYQAHILLDLNDAPRDLYDFYELDSTHPKCQVIVPSGHGLGKTRVMSVAIWHHQLTRAFSKRLVTAPTSDQITGQLFGAVRKMRRRLGNFGPTLAADWDVLSDSIRHKNPDYGDWATVARTARGRSRKSACASTRGRAPGPRRATGARPAGCCRRSRRHARRRAAARAARGPWCGLPTARHGPATSAACSRRCAWRQDYDRCPSRA